MKIYFLFLLFTQNNIFLTITDSKGSIFFWKSIGMLKTKGLKKLVPSNIKNLILFSLGDKKEFHKVKFHLRLKGYNKSKKNLLKILLNTLTSSVLSICDSSLLPYNGCRLKKNRRL